MNKVIACAHEKGVWGKPPTIISGVMEYLIAHSDEDSFPDFEYTSRSVRDTYGSLVRVFKSEIPFAIRAAEVPEKDLSIYAYDLNGRVAKPMKH